MLGISPFFARRMRALGPEAPPEEDYLDMPEVEPFPEVPDPLMEPGPATKALSAHVLGGTPTHEPIGLGKGLLSTLAAALAGFGQNSALQGAALGRGIIEEPYRKAVDEYNLKSKSLGEVADMEADNRREKRLWAESKANRDARIAEAEARRLAAGKKEPRQFKPDVEYDKQGFATGRVFDSDEMVMKTVPGLKGMRRSQEPAALTAKKANTELSIYKAKELQRTFDLVSKKFSTPLLGNTRVGPIQGSLSKMATAAGLENDPDVINMHKIAQDLANHELYALSGAQINNKEYERLRQTLPDTEKGEEAFKTDIIRFIQFHEAALQGLISENDIDWVPGAAPNISPSIPPTGTDVHDVQNSSSSTSKYKIRRRNP